MSMWICLNLSSDARNSPTGAWVCRPTLALWHLKYVFVHALTSALIRGQTNLLVSKCMDALVPEWDKLCTAVKMSLQKDAGTYERNFPCLCRKLSFLRCWANCNAVFSFRRRRQKSSSFCYSQEKVGISMKGSNRKELIPQDKASVGMFSTPLMCLMPEVHLSDFPWRVYLVRGLQGAQ